MPDYEANGEDIDNYGSSPIPKSRSSHGGYNPDDYTDSKPQHCSREYEKDRTSSRSREKDREKGRDRDRGRERDKDRDREREKDRDRHHRDRHRDHSDRRERERTRDRDDDERHRTRDYDKERDHDKDRESRHRHRSRSRRRSGSRSRSRSKSKRISGFDMAPPTTAMLPGATAAAGQVPGTNPAIAGMLPNMFPLTSGQFGALPVMPIQAMTQQATRHARRVYVGGLPATSNEQLCPST